MNAAIVNALAWEEWLRVRTWWGWALTVFAANSVFFWAITDHGPLGPTVNAFMREFNDAYAVRIPTILVLLTIYAIVMFTPLIAYAIIATYPDRAGISAGIPGRYLTLPVHRGLLIVVQLGVRLALAAPFTAFPVVLYAQIRDRSEWLDLAMYLSTGPTIGLIGALAVAVWWRLLGPVSVALCLVAPLGFWASDLFVVMELGETSVRGVIGLIWAVIGFASGGLLLGWSAPFESLSFPMAFSQESSAARRGRTAFAGPNAAVLWAERPFSVWWPVGLCICVGLTSAAYSLYVARADFGAVQWVPWTPQWIKLAGMLQLFFLETSKAMITWWPVLLCLTMVVEAFLFLRRNYLRRPFASRLPIGAAAFSWHACLAVLLHLLKASCIATGVAAGVYFICDGNNVAAPYLWNGPDHYDRFTVYQGYIASPFTHGEWLSLTRSWQDYADDLATITIRFASSMLLFMFSSVLVAWLEMFPVNWAMLGLIATSMDTDHHLPWEAMALACVALTAAYISRRERRRTRAMLFLGAAFTVLVLGLARTMQPGNQHVSVVELLDTSMIHPDLEDVVYFTISLTAFLLLPFASLWSVLKVRSRL